MNNDSTVIGDNGPGVGNDYLEVLDIPSAGTGGVLAPPENLVLGSAGNLEFLEPLFSDCPSVNHKYTTKLAVSWGWASKASDYKCGYEISADLCTRGNVILFWDAGGLDLNFSVGPYPGSLSHLLSVCAVGGTPAPVDVTKYSREFHTYSHLLRFMSARSKRLNSLRVSALARLPYAVAGPRGIDYDYLYDLSGHRKFSGGRPQTHVFSLGRTFTYSKLPVFPVPSKQIIRKGRTKNKPGSSVASVGGVPSVQCSTVLNPLASVFNFDVNNLRSVSKDCGATLRDLRVQGVGNIIIAHLNINSLRNKFDSLVQLIGGSVDILVIGETKLDASFPKKQFMIRGFKEPYRNDRNGDGGGVMIYVRDDIPCQEREYRLPNNVEGLIIEINLRKMKFLLLGIYHSTNKKYGSGDDVFLREIGTVLDVYSSYDKFLVVGDFNMQEGDVVLDDFLDEFHAKNLVKEPTCFKNPGNPSCVDLFITNSSGSFMRTSAVSTGLSDFHKMIVTVMRTTFPRGGPLVVQYRDVSGYDPAAFRMDLGMRMGDECVDYDTFERIFLEVFDFHAPRKSKVVRANHKPYVSKEMRRAIMHRSRLQNLFHKYKTPECNIAFKRQKNYCNRLYKKERREYYSNLNLNNITDNRKFWRTVKPLFGDKGGAREKIVLVEGDKIVDGDAEVAQTFNDFFDGAVGSLGISENIILQTKVERSCGKVLDAIKMYESHPSVLRIRENVSVCVEFSFSPVSLGDVRTELEALDIRKAIPFMSIPPKQLKEVVDVVAKPLQAIWNGEILLKKKFPSKLLYVYYSTF